MKFPFPREDLRELILNALVHKDYASNTPIQISVYRDKIYVGNIGSLPESWSVKTLLGKHNSRPANPTIAGCIYLTGLIETWGRGIEKVKRECKKHGCPEPSYEVNAGEPGDLLVRVDAAPDALVEGSVAPEETTQSTTQRTTHTPPATVTETVTETVIDKVGKAATKLYVIIKAHPNGTAAEMAKKMHLTVRGVRYLLQKLKDANLARFVGNPKSGHWEVV